LKRHSPFETSFSFHSGRTLESEANVRKCCNASLFKSTSSCEEDHQNDVAYCGVSAFTTRVALVGFDVFVMKFLEIRSELRDVCLRLCVIDFYQFRYFLV